MFSIPNLDRLVNEIEKLNMWLAMLNGFPATTDPHKLPHEKMKMKYKDVLHPGSIAELIIALNKLTETKNESK
jgi:hypothetical protein